MAVRLYNFEEVPKWSREQVAIQESLARYYSYRPFSIDFAEALASDLEAYLKVPCRFSAPDMQTVSGLKLGRLVPSVAVMAVVGAGPTEHKIVADIDPALVSFCIDRLLGGSGETGRIRRPLTDIEE